MKAVVFAGRGEVRVDDVPAPAVQDAGDAVVAVTKTAICGSDLHLLHGKTPGMREGGVIGHEFVGRVASVGEAVTTHREGDRVLGSFLIACGRCSSCALSRYNHCQNRRALGLGALTGDLDGAQAEYVRVPDAEVNLKRLAGPLERLSDEAALFAGDILTTGFYAAAAGAISSGDCAVVIGGGPVGIFTAAAARRRGAERVIVLEADATRARLLEQHLHLEVVRAAGGDPLAELHERTNGAMADVAFEAVGAIAAFKTALRCARDGGRVVIVGVYGSERYELPMGMIWVRGLTLTFAGMANIQAHWDDALEAILHRSVDPTALITHRLPLDEAAQGYELFASRAALKVVLTP